ncbi:hypothetical protein BH10PSE7_BH10PSE7_15290 [soil metagenome]
MSKRNCSEEERVRRSERLRLLMANPDVRARRRAAIKAACAALPPEERARRAERLLACSIASREKRAAQLAAAASDPAFQARRLRGLKSYLEARRDPAHPHSVKMRAAAQGAREADPAAWALKQRRAQAKHNPARAAELKARWENDPAFVARLKAGALSEGARAKRAASMRAYRQRMIKVMRGGPMIPRETRPAFETLVTQGIDRLGAARLCVAHGGSALRKAGALARMVAIGITPDAALRLAGFA